MSDPALPPRPHKTVVVRRGDYDPEPDADDSPTRPPRVLFWFRLMCATVAVVALVCGGVTAAHVYGPGWADKLRWAVGFAVLFAVYSVPLWWRRPQRWHQGYGAMLIAPAVLIPLLWPVGVPLIIFWFRRRNTAFHRDPSAGYAPPRLPADSDAPQLAEPPAVLFYLRWLCLLGCVVCLLGVPLSAVLARLDPNAGWSWLPWAGGFAVGFALFVVPLFARTPRPWVWWYGLVLLVLCSLTGYLTLLAVPVLLFWLTKGPRRYFAGNHLPRPAL